MGKDHRFVIYYKERDGMLRVSAYDTAEEADKALDEIIKVHGYSYYDHPYEIKEESGEVDARI